MSLEDLALGLVSLPASVDPFADLNMEQPLGSAGTALAVVSLKYSPTKEVPRLKTPKSTASSARCRSALYLNSAKSGRSRVPSRPSTTNTLGRSAPNTAEALPPMPKSGGKRPISAQARIAVPSSARIATPSVRPVSIAARPGSAAPRSATSSRPGSAAPSARPSRPQSASPSIGSMSTDYGNWGQATTSMATNRVLPRQEVRFTDPHRLIAGASNHPYFSIEHPDPAIHHQEEKERELEADKLYMQEQAARAAEVEEQHRIMRETKRSIAKATAAANIAMYRSRKAPEVDTTSTCLLWARPPTDHSRIRQKRTQFAMALTQQRDTYDASAEKGRLDELELSRKDLEAKMQEHNEIVVSVRKAKIHGQTTYKQDLDTQVDTQLDATLKETLAENDAWAANEGFKESCTDEDFKMYTRAGEVNAATVNIHMHEDRQALQITNKAADIAHELRLLEDMKVQMRKEMVQKQRATKKAQRNYREALARAATVKMRRDVASARYRGYGAPMMLLEQVDHYLGNAFSGGAASTRPRLPAAQPTRGAEGMAPVPANLRTSSKPQTYLAQVVTFDKKHELDVDDDEGLGSSPPASPGPPMAFADSTMPPIAAN